MVEKYNAFTCNLTTSRGAGVRFLEVAVALVIKEFEQRRPKLTSKKRRKINSRTHMYLFMKASRVVFTRCLVSRGNVDLIRYTE